MAMDCISVQRYCTINNPSMPCNEEENYVVVNADDKMFIDYTGSKLWIYPHGEQPREVELFVSILGCSSPLSRTVFTYKS